MENLHNHDGYRLAALTALLDGLTNALKELVQHKLDPSVRMGRDIHWVLSSDYRPRSFKWYCDVFNISPEIIRNKLELDANNYINNNTPLPKYKSLIL